MLLRGFREARRKLRDFIKAGEQDRLCIIREASEADPKRKAALRREPARASMYGKLRGRAAFGG